MLVNPAPGGPDVDHLGTRASNGQPIYRAPCENKHTTVGQLDIEQHILRQAAAWPQLIHTERAEAAAAAAGQISAGQAETVLALLTSATAVTVVRAAAGTGTGKTGPAAAFARAWTQLTPSSSSSRAA